MSECTHGPDAFCACKLIKAQEDLRRDIEGDNLPGYARDRGMYGNDRHVPELPLLQPPINIIESPHLPPNVWYLRNAETTEAIRDFFFIRPEHLVPEESIKRRSAADELYKQQMVMSFQLAPYRAVMQGCLEDIANITLKLLVLRAMEWRVQKMELHVALHIRYCAKGIAALVDRLLFT